MEFIHSINDSIFGVNTPEELKLKLEEYYSWNGVKPIVEIISDKFVRVILDDSRLMNIEKKMDKALSLCNQSKFDDAKVILNEVTKECPLYSEAWRNLAQIHLNHEHNVDLAYDELIEALKCDPRNLWALILMGNLLVREKNDVETANKYFNNVLEYHPVYSIEF